MILSSARIEFAGTWPRSLDYGDIFFASDGPGETHRVFIEPMRLSAMFRELRESQLRIGELGFGTGLNFLVVAEAFTTNAAESSRLDYIAFEKHPLARTHLARIAKRHSPPLALAEELIACWPHLLCGWHIRYLAGGRIRLILYFGDALKGLADLKARCHAWLLDGFDPALNPDMWSQPLIEQVAGHSEGGASVATFTAQGAVRRRLEAVGFEMRRVDQRPHKRHSLAGTLRKQNTSIPREVSEVAVVGAGFAGAFTAHLLARRGICVHLYDPGRAPMPMALAHVRLGDPTNPMMQLRALAKGYSNDWYRRLGASAGVLEAPVEAKTRSRMERSAEVWGQADDSIQLLEPDESRRLTNFSKIATSLWHSQCHLVSQDILDLLLRHARITMHRMEVVSVAAEGKHWKLAFRDAASQSFSHLIICAGAGSLRLLPHLGATCIAGQLEIASTPHPLPVPLVGKGFAAPLDGNYIALGATYEQSPLTESEARQENLKRAQDWFQALGGASKHEHHSCWRGQRVYSEDRLPMAGEVAAGLFVNTAHGASGSVLAPFCAELVVSQLLADPLPMTQALAVKVRATRSRAS